MNKPKITAGNNLKYLRTVYNISVKDLAAFLEMSENNYHKIERNEIGLSFLHASKISELVCISIEVLIKDSTFNLANYITKNGEEFVKQNLALIKNKLKLPPPI